MNMLKIVAVSKYYAVDIGDNRIHMLNEKSLIYFLKKRVGLCSNAVSSIMDIFEHSDERVVEIDLNHTERKVS